MSDMIMSKSAKQVCDSLYAALPDMMGCLEQGSIPGAMEKLQAELDRRHMGNAGCWYVIDQLRAQRKPGYPANDHFQYQSAIEALRSDLCNNPELTAAVKMLEGIYESAEVGQYIALLHCSDMPPENILYTLPQMRKYMGDALITHAGIGKQQAEVAAGRFLNGMLEVVRETLGVAATPDR